MAETAATGTDKLGVGVIGSGVMGLEHIQNLKLLQVCAIDAPAAHATRRRAMTESDTPRDTSHPRHATSRHATGRESHMCRRYE